MKCPKCNESMVVLELADVEIDYCYSCEGIWLDQGELELLTGEDDIEDRLLSFLEEDKRSGEKKVKCPVCQKKMKKVFTTTDNPICLDKCRKDHGYWFDKGELNSILELGIGSVDSKVINLLRNLFSK